MNKKIPKGWKKVKLEEVAKKIVSGGTPSTKKSEYYNGNIPWLNTKEIKNCRIYKTEKYISKEGLDNSSAKWIEKNSVIVAMYGATAGKVAINKIPLTTNQACCNITPNNKKIDYNFVYYYLLSKFKKLVTMTSGAAQQNLNVGLIKNFNITCPSLPEQRAIAKVLSSLDDKIDLLHRQNKTLEEMAETLFRKWFIEDAKEDWEERPLKEVCEIKNGYAFKSNSYQEQGQKIIRTLNFKNGFIELKNLVYISKELAKSFDKYYLKRKDFLLVMVGANIGNHATVTNDILPALQNQNMWCFRSIYPYFQLYLNYFLKQLIKEKINITSGSAREFFQKKVFYKFTIPVPDKNNIYNFNKIINSIFDKIENNRIQIRTLEKLRDTLLPKLMSGEVRVKIE